MTPARCSEASMSEQEGSHYVRTHEYTSGSAKTRLTMSAPSFYDEDNSLEEVISPTSHDFQEGEFVCAGFFQMINPENFVHRVVAPDWDYMMRRQAQAILPFLYLGPVSCLKDKAWLAQEGFTLLLAIRNKRSAQARLVSGEKVGAELGIEADAVDVMDNQELISAFPYAIRRINDHLVSSGPAVDTSAPGKKVFVFCESGNERSATVVIAYLMVMLNLNMAVASHLVQLRRFCICVEEPLRELLASFQSILDAKRDVQKAIQASTSNSTLAIPQATVSRKRSIADRLDEPTTTGGDTVGMDMDMNMNIMDDGSIDSRKPLAPFQDRSN
ncbi:dual specificity protein phosphatase family protein [Aspergillus novofumigatus IBT 16806]|uniref:Dual specificity protein phosphatase 3 n=1 Tax=Aspergillus novofumigatus (strain IBT 16806) TaxID=1392255 RepID=A0A2I1C8Z1_ASPN1|nr:dual specificity protein phosphatase 3 [Aspergillus novofumigatus IBT 16806]PKX94061.1 dual specificity protein phosphatase 3 [Aspergillus novofumigatus IBT 16806]